MTNFNLIRIMRFQKLSNRSQVHNIAHDNIIRRNKHNIHLDYWKKLQKKIDDGSKKERTNQVTAIAGKGEEINLLAIVNGAMFTQIRKFRRSHREIYRRKPPEPPKFPDPAIEEEPGRVERRREIWGSRRFRMGMRKKTESFSSRQSLDFSRSLCMPVYQLPRYYSFKYKLFHIAKFLFL